MVTSSRASNLPDKSSFVQVDEVIVDFVAVFVTLIMYMMRKTWSQKRAARRAERLEIARANNANNPFLLLPGEIRNHIYRELYPVDEAFYLTYVGPGSRFGRRRRKTYMKRSWTHSLKYICRQLRQETSVFELTRAYHCISGPKDLLPRYGRMSQLRRHTLTRLHIRMSILHEVEGFMRVIIGQWGSFRNAFPNIEWVIIQHLCFCGVWDGFKSSVKSNLCVLDKFLFVGAAGRLRVKVRPRCSFWSRYVHEMEDHRVRIEFDLSGENVVTYPYWDSKWHQVWHIL